MSANSRKIPVTILGATGVVGQRFVRRLVDHPWFEIAHLAASERSAGRRYADACDWRLAGEAYGGLGDRILVPAEPVAAAAPVVFSALDAASARELEPAFAASGSWLFSNASAFRMAEDVPLLVPEVNPDHLALVERQQRERGFRGAIVCNPNCTATLLALVLAPLDRAFGVEAAVMSSMQAVSGAGYPGVPSLDIVGNVVPYIRGEEEKVEEETGKLLGRRSGDSLRPHPAPISALCHRVAVLDGHTEALSVRLGGTPTPAQVSDCLAGFRGAAEGERLPSAPAVPLAVHQRPDRPQPRLDLAETGRRSDGMTVHVGRIRTCPVSGIKLTLVGHNAERGAAGASLLNAELAAVRGLLPGGEIAAIVGPSR
ncbi:MAG: aspartate-semialdehyde dehydrogenase [Thermoanaerobaculia bacterium]